MSGTSVVEFGLINRVGKIQERDAELNIDGSSSLCDD
jgi:hypothetical protein